MVVGVVVVVVVVVVCCDRSFLLSIYYSPFFLQFCVFTVRF